MQLDSSMPISVGDIVLISSYGNTKFIVCRGWYTYKSTRRSGWYFKSIPNGDVVPDFEVDTADITTVSYASNGSCDCKPPVYEDDCDCCKHEHSCKPKQPGAPFVTVNTVDERNRVGHPYPDDGQIVRVNSVRGEVKYYIWDAENLKWDPFEFPANTETKDAIEDINQTLATATEDIKVIKQNAEWILLNSEQDAGQTE